MTEDVYKDLCKALQKRPGRYRGMDIPEFYELARELFTPEEAAVCAAQPRGLQPAAVIAGEMGKDEAREILEKSEEAGLVHCTVNRQDIDWRCNCCSCHCVLLKTALATPRPGLFINSGFQPRVDANLCTACGICVDRWPASALALEDNETPALDLDRCIGCGVCATGCPERQSPWRSGRDPCPRPQTPRLTGRRFGPAVSPYQCIFSIEFSPQLL